jgi:hypothetical protein
MEDKKLQKLIKKYNKVCYKLEQFNEQAFELEKEMHYLHNSKIIIQNHKLNLTGKHDTSRSKK